MQHFGLNGQKKWVNLHHPDSLGDLPDVLVPVHTRLYEASMDHCVSPCASLALIPAGSRTPLCMLQCWGQCPIPEQPSPRQQPGLFHDVTEGQGTRGSLVPALGAVGQRLQRG